MTISTAKGNSTSIWLMFFCVVIFVILRFFFNDLIFKNESLILVYMFITISALVTSLVYISISLFFTHRFEKKIMDKSEYIQDYNINLFIAINPIYVLKLKKGTFEFYFNHIYLHATPFFFNKLEYILKLKSRFAKLNKIDILCIYLYKYISIFFSTVYIFVLFNGICELIKYNNNLNLFLYMFMFILILISIPVYIIFTKIVNYCIIKIMKKRDLEFFMYK